MSVFDPPTNLPYEVRAAWRHEAQDNFRNPALLHGILWHRYNSVTINLLNPDEFYADALAACRNSTTVAELEAAMAAKQAKRKAELEDTLRALRKEKFYSSESNKTANAAFNAARAGSLLSFVRLVAGCTQGVGWDKVDTRSTSSDAYDYLLPRGHRYRQDWQFNLECTTVPRNPYCRKAGPYKPEDAKTACFKNYPDRNVRWLGDEPLCQEERGTLPRPLVPQIAAESTTHVKRDSEPDNTPNLMKKEKVVETIQQSEPVGVNAKEKSGRVLDGMTDADENIRCLDREEVVREAALKTTVEEETSAQRTMSEGKSDQALGWMTDAHQIHQPSDQDSQARLGNKRPFSRSSLSSNASVETETHTARSEAETDETALSMSPERKKMKMMNANPVFQTVDVQGQSAPTMQDAVLEPKTSCSPSL